MIEWIVKGKQYNGNDLEGEVKQIIGIFETLAICKEWSLVTGKSRWVVRKFENHPYRCGLGAVLFSEKTKAQLIEAAFYYALKYGEEKGGVY